MIAGSYRVYESVNGAIAGSTTARWYINSGDLTKNTLADRSFINQLNYAWSDNTKAIVGTNDGNVQMGFNLGVGTANTATWVNVTGANAILPNRPILDVFQFNCFFGSELEENLVVDCHCRTHIAQAETVCILNRKLVVICGFSDFNSKFTLDCFNKSALSFHITGNCLANAN